MNAGEVLVVRSSKVVYRLPREQINIVQREVCIKVCVLIIHNSSPTLDVLSHFVMMPKASRFQLENTMIGRT